MINSASTGQVRYWQREAVRSSWEGDAVAELGLSSSPGEGQGRHDLSALLAGRHPVSAAPLTARPGLRRRQGWDLVFAAPKSLSLLASSGAQGSEKVLGAHRRAVSDAIGVLADNAALVSQGGRLLPATGVVAAGFEHSANAAGEPHLHTHVVLPNLARRPDGGWGCLAGPALWTWREAVSAAFHLALRASLNAEGLAFSWEVMPGGMAEALEVPAQARTASASRSRAVRAAVVAFGSPGSAARRVAQGSSRPARGAVAPARTGEGSVDAASLLARAARRPCLPPPPPSTSAVAGALAERSSGSAPPEVWVALAETCPSGLPAAQAQAWVQAAPGLLAAGGPAGGGPSNRVAARYDDEVLDAALDGRFAHLAEVPRVVAEAELAALGFGGGTAEAALALACSGHAISVVGPAGWMAQAACVDAARAAWQAAGVPVAVATPSELGARRWQALTGLEAPERGAARRWAVRGAALGSVLVVDAADHVAPAALARLARGAAAAGTKLVLVLGGTAGPAGRPASSSLEQLARSQVEPGSWPARSQASAPAWTPYSLAGLVVRGAPTGAQAARSALAAAAASGAPVVAYGGPEAEALNLVASGPPAASPSPELLLAGRPFRAGVPVVALRRLGPIPAATRGTVMSLDSRCITVRWHLPDRSTTSQVGAAEATSVGLGYAVTLPYLRTLPTGRALVCLGPPDQLGARSRDVGFAVVTVAGPGRPALGPHDPARVRSAARSLVLGWPDEAVLEQAGPRPGSPAALRRWAAELETHALERLAGLPARPGPSRLPRPAVPVHPTHPTHPVHPVPNPLPGRAGGPGLARADNPGLGPVPG